MLIFHYNPGLSLSLSLSLSIYIYIYIYIYMVSSYKCIHMYLHLCVYVQLYLQLNCLIKTVDWIKWQISIKLAKGLLLAFFFNLKMKITSLILKLQFMNDSNPLHKFNQSHLPSLMNSFSLSSDALTTKLCHWSSSSSSSSRWANSTECQNIVINASLCFLRKLEYSYVIWWQKFLSTAISPMTVQWGLTLCHQFWNCFYFAANFHISLRHLIPNWLEIYTIWLKLCISVI